MDSKIFVRKLLAENNMYTQGLYTQKAKICLPETSYKIGIEDLECPGKLGRLSKTSNGTPKKSGVARNLLDSALKQLHQKRDAMFGGSDAQPVHRISLPSSTQQTPRATVLHPTFQSLLKPTPVTTEPRTADLNQEKTPTPKRSESAPWSNPLPQAYNFMSDNLPQGSVYGKPNIFSQSVKRDNNKNTDVGLLSETRQPFSSSPASCTGMEKGSSFGSEQFSPILGSFGDRTLQSGFHSQDWMSKSNVEQPSLTSAPHLKYNTPAIDQYHHKRPGDRELSDSQPQSVDAGRFFNCPQEPDLPQFFPNTELKTKSSPQVNESWTQFSSRFQSACKRPRSSSYSVHPKPFSFYGMSEDEEEDKPRSLWSLIEESPKRKQTVPQRPVPPIHDKAKDLFDSNSWFHVSPLCTSTPVKDLQREEDMEQSPTYEKILSARLNTTMSRPKDDGNESQGNIDQVLTESCFITPRASSIHKFRSLSSTLTPESFAKDTTTDMTTYCDETLNTTTSEQETTNVQAKAECASPKSVTPKPVIPAGETIQEESKADCVTPKKITSRQITDFFQRVSTKGMTPPPVSVCRLQAKKTPSFTPYLSPIEEASTDFSHEKMIEKKVDKTLAEEE